MSYNVLTTSNFKTDSKNLIKKYKSLKEELLELIELLEKFPNQGTPLGNDCYKIRLAIKSKGKGKSGGARVITCVKILDEIFSLLLVIINQKKIILLTKN